MTSTPFFPSGSAGKQGVLHGNHKPPPTKVFYESVEELIDEWQASGDEDPIWEYLEMPEEQFRAWMRHLRQNKFDH